MQEKKPYGLVVCGGRSTRMGQDKSRLVYHDKEQRYHVYDLLTPFCDRVFISCNKNQAATIDVGYLVIIDEEKYENKGPIAAILSAFSKFPKQDFILIGCDYPFINLNEIEQIFKGQTDRFAAACFNNTNQLYEPMLAYYPAKSFTQLVNQFNNGHYSLQHFLKLNNATKISVYDEKALTSIDTRDTYLQAKKLLANS